MEDRPELNPSPEDLTQPFEPGEVTQEFRLPPEKEEALETLIDRFRAEALAAVRGVAQTIDGKTYICSNVTPRLEMILENPQTGQILVLPYRKEIPTE